VTVLTSSSPRSNAVQKGSPGLFSPTMWRWGMDGGQPGTLPGMSLALDTIARATWNTVSPVRCAGCGRPDVACCHVCASELRPDVHHPTLAIRRALFDVPVVAGARYQGVVKRVVTTYKERGLVSLGRYLSGPLRAAVSALGREVSLDGVVVVCVPHSRSGWVRRGRHPTRDLVRRAGWARSLAPAGALRFPVPRPQKVSTSNQKNRTRRERLSTPPTFVGGVELTGRRVLLIDDVLTTGISLEYAARAIESVGGVVVGGVVVAATPPRAQKISM
jgi:predicted amidophosphoribosyltransferase